MITAGENIDRLINLEIRRPNKRTGFKWALYQMARNQLDKPMILAGAELLNCKPCNIGIFSGAAVPTYMPNGENDGPFGSVILMKVLSSIGHNVKIYTDNACAYAFKQLLNKYNLKVSIEIIDDFKDVDFKKIIDNVDILISIERLGGNINGNLYGVTGISRNKVRKNLDKLFVLAKSKKKLILSIGDGGNEIGFGNIYSELKKNWDHLSLKNKTTCGGGIFSIIKCSVLVTGSNSNLGTYGIIAGLALLRNDKSLCHTAEEEYELHKIGLELGLRDGSTGDIIQWCDGVPVKSGAAIVQIIYDIVEHNLMKVNERKF